MDNTTTQPSHLRPFDDIIPVGLISNDLARQNVQDKLTQASALEELNKKINEFNVEKDNFAKHKKRETEKLQAKQKALDEQESRIMQKHIVLQSDKKRVNEQNKQVLQDKAKNDARKKELDKLEEQIRQNFDESESKLQLIKDDYARLDSLSVRASINLERLEDGLQKVYGIQDHLESHLNYDEQFAILFQKLADNDVKNDLILEELNHFEAPKAKKQTKSKSHSDQLNLFHAESETTQTIKVLSSDYIFRLKDGDSYDECINITDFIDTYSRLSLMNENVDQFFSTFEFVFSEGDELPLEVGFNDLHEDTQNDLLNIFS